MYLFGTFSNRLCYWPIDVIHGGKIKTSEKDYLRSSEHSILRYSFVFLSFFVVVG